MSTQLRDVYSGSASNLALEVGLLHGSRSSNGLTANQIAEICYEIDDYYTKDTYRRRVWTCEANDYLEVINPNEHGPSRFKGTTNGRQRLNEIDLYSDIDNLVDARPR